MLAKKKWLSNSQKYNGLGTVRNTMVEQQSEIRLLRNRQKYNGWVTVRNTIVDQQSEIWWLSNSQKYDGWETVCQKIRLYVVMKTVRNTTVDQQSEIRWLTNSQKYDGWATVRNTMVEQSEIQWLAKKVLLMALFVKIVCQPIETEVVVRIIIKRYECRAFTSCCLAVGSSVFCVCLCVFFRRSTSPCANKRWSSAPSSHTCASTSR